MVRQFPDEMMARVSRVMESGDSSNPFNVTNGVKQGCILAPAQFAAMLLDALHDLHIGVHMRFRTDGKLFNLRKLQAKTKVFEELVCELLFADDYALVANTSDDMQLIMDRA